MVTLGIDVGSTATKAVVFDGTVLSGIEVPTGWNPREAGERALTAALEEAGVTRRAVAHIIGTGYGRLSLPFVDRRVTEIACHARGAHYLFPATKLVIDIGGQDSKVIGVADGGTVSDFIMNDKCAAGTGRFLQVMTGVLDITLDELGTLAADADPVGVSSMCAVFAESEVIGLLARGVDKGAIAAGIIKSIACKVQSLVQRMRCGGEVTFTGGIARNPEVCRVLSRHLGLSLNTPEQPYLVGALGAALIAYKETDPKACPDDKNFEIHGREKI